MNGAAGGGRPQVPGANDPAALVANLNAAQRDAVAARLRTRLREEPPTDATAVNTMTSAVQTLADADRSDVITALRARTRQDSVGRLAAEISSWEPAPRAEAERQLRLRSADGAGATYPLSPAQEQLWFLDQLHPGSSFYNIASTHRFRGPLDTEAYRQAVLGVIDRHESLRTRYVAAQGIPGQLIDGPGQAEVAAVDPLGSGAGRC